MSHDYPPPHGATLRKALSLRRSEKSIFCEKNKTRRKIEKAKIREF